MGNYISNVTKDGTLLVGAGLTDTIGWTVNLPYCLPSHQSVLDTVPAKKASNNSDQNCFTYRGIEY